MRVRRYIKKVVILRRVWKKSRLEQGCERQNQIPKKTLESKQTNFLKQFLYYD